MVHDAQSTLAIKVGSYIAGCDHCKRHSVRITHICLLRICYAWPAAPADVLLLVHRVQRLGRQQTGERAIPVCEQARADKC